MMVKDMKNNYKYFEEILINTDSLKIYHPIYHPADAKLAIGYGADAYELTADDINRLTKGEILELDSQGEYSIFIRINTSISEVKEP